MRNWLIGVLSLTVVLTAVWFLVERSRQGLKQPTNSAAEGTIPVVAADPVAADPVAANPFSANPGSMQSAGSERQKISDTIYRNVEPTVQYVGDSNCAECHAAICGTYHQHPMGRSAIPAGSDSLEQYGSEAKNPFRVGPYELNVVHSDSGMLHRISASLSDGTKLPACEVPVQVAIGSGTRGRSYLTIEGEYVWQSPISWYSTNQRWDVSPGFDLGYATQRPIVSECLYCHVQRFDSISHSVNRYREPIDRTQLAIGCERCHGPGQLHAEEHRADTWKDHAIGDIDTSIVNPAHLSESLQMSICAQCHLSGKERVVRRGRQESEFRPGLPLEQYVTAFLAHPDAPFRNKAVSHFDQTSLAKCTTNAGSKLLCTSCHDPHQSPAEDTVQPFYNKQCIECHIDRGCSAPVETRQAKNDSCIDCHMPKSSSSNIPHTSLTDHRIRRDPSAQDAKGSFDVSDIPLILYAREGLDDAEIDRDLGIALSRFAAKQAANSPFRKEALEKARAKLSQSLARWPDDLDAWLALSETEKWRGNMAEALSVAQSGLKKSPQNEELLAQVANLADSANQPELAIDTLNQLIAMVPSSHDYRAKRMLTCVTLGRWDQAEEDCRALLRLNPLFPSAHMVLAMSLHGDGKKGEASRAIAKAIELSTTPAQKASMQSWFDRFVAWRAKFDE